MLFAAADGAAAAELDVELDGVSPPPPYWALTIIGRNTAVNARDNFMVVGKAVIGLREGRDSSWDGSFGVDNFFHF